MNIEKANKINKEILNMNNVLKAMSAARKSKNKKNGGKRK